MLFNGQDRLCVVFIECSFYKILEKIKKVQGESNKAIIIIFKYYQLLLFSKKKNMFSLFIMF